MGTRTHIDTHTLSLCRAYDGIIQLLANQSMIAAPATKPDYPAYVVTNDNRWAKPTKGGFTEVFVSLNEAVKQGQKVAVMVC